MYIYNYNVLFQYIKFVPLKIHSLREAATKKFFLNGRAIKPHLPLKLKFFFWFFWLNIFSLIAGSLTAPHVLMARPFKKKRFLRLPLIT